MALAWRGAALHLWRTIDRVYLFQSVSCLEPHCELEKLLIDGLQTGILGASQVPIHQVPIRLTVFRHEQEGSP